MPLGWEGRKPTVQKNTQSTAREFLQPPTDAQLSPRRSRQAAAEWVENSLWWSPLLHWHSFTTNYCCQCASLLWFQTLGTVLKKTRYLWHTAKCLWQMYNATCLQCSLCDSFMFDPQGEGSETKGRCWVHDRNLTTLLYLSLTVVWFFFFLPKSLIIIIFCYFYITDTARLFFFIISDDTVKRKKGSHSSDAHMLCIQPHWSSLQQVPYPPLQHCRHETAADYGWMRPAVGRWGADKKASHSGD